MLRILFVFLPVAQRHLPSLREPSLRVRQMSVTQTMLRSIGKDLQYCNMPMFVDVHACREGGGRAQAKGASAQRSIYLPLLSANLVHGGDAAAVSQIPSLRRCNPHLPLR